MKTNEITGVELCRGRHGDAPGVRSPRKRRAGVRRGSAPLAVLLALVMALAFPARARADGVLPSSGWQPFTFYTQDRGADGTFYCVTNSASDFNTALHLIGRMSDYLQLSNEQLAKLSNEGSGGRFYQLAKSFESAAGWNEDTNLPHEWSVAMGAVDAAGILYGHGNTWWGTVTDELLQGAKTDYMVIYNGGSLGGGGNGPVEETADYIVVPCRVLFTGTNNNRINMVDTSGQMYCNIPNYSQSYRTLPNVINFRIRKSLFNANTLSQHVITDACVRFTNIYDSSGNLNNGTAQIRLISNSSSRVTVSLNDYSFTKDGQSYSGQYYGSAVEPANSYSLTYTVSGNYFSFDGTTITDTSTNTSSNRWVLDSSEVTVFSGDNKLAGCTSGSDGGGGGDNNWPGPSDDDEPGPPEPVPQPEPDPGPGPIDWPDPYNPTVPSPNPEPTPTTPVTNPSNTSPADYTPWLMAILSELRGIHTDMNAWLDAIFEGVVDYGAAVCSHIDTASENVRSTLRFMTQWMDEQLDSSFYQLRHLLWECANYIADSLDYTFVGPDVNVPGYDDSSVLYWLKRIYYKLGSGNVNTRPVDPVADHDNWWDWIVQLIKNFILDLGMMGSDFLSDMGDVLSEVVQKFPFSIPWDIAAYLTAFSTQPVTPVIVITIPAMSGFLPQIQWTIDLHPYDDAMATVRACETIVFAFWLMWKCPILLDMMDTAKWGI